MHKEFQNLPGADLVEKGLKDLRAGSSDTKEALLVLIARTRLSNLGLSIEEGIEVSEPEFKLYDLCERENKSSSPHSYYNSLIRRLNSFCSALESLPDK